MGVLANLAIEQLKEFDTVTAPAGIESNEIVMSTKTPLVTKVDSRVESETDGV